MQVLYKLLFAKSSYFSLHPFVDVQTQFAEWKVTTVNERDKNQTNLDYVEKNEQIRKLKVYVAVDVVSAENISEFPTTSGMFAENISEFPTTPGMFAENISEFPTISGMFAENISEFPTTPGMFAENISEFPTTP